MYTDVVELLLEEFVGQSFEGAPMGWRLQDAKAKFSELFRLARVAGPQKVTKHGKEAVMIIGFEEYERLIRRPPKRKGGGKKKKR